MMAQSALIAAWIAGLLGGLHCAAMCGGWLAVVSRPPAAPARLWPARALITRQLTSHAGRILTYVVLGAVVGAAGGTAFAATLQPVQRGLYVAANVALLLLAWSLARGTRSGGGSLEAAGLGLFRRAAPLFSRALEGEGAGSRFAVGLLWGLTPCALVYGLLPVALLSGSAGNGALIMLAFGLGTLPNLLAAGYAAMRLRARASSARWRYAGAAVIVLFAALGLYRAFFVPDALGHGPFCVVQVSVDSWQLAAAGAANQPI